MTVEVPLFVGGTWRSTAEAVEVVDPYRGQVSSLAYRPTNGDVDDAVASALDGARVMAAMPTHQRAAILSRVADGVEAVADDYARRIVLDCGKCLRDARGEVTRAIEVLRVSAEEATKTRGELIPMDGLPAGVGERIGMALRFPVGVVAAIGPFNAPLQVICHKLGPALAAGNAVVCKPATQGAAVTADLVRLFLEAGLPPSALQLLPTGGESIGDYLVAHEGIDLIAFTGSGAVGERIVRTAGLKRTLLELSGNAAVVIHEDADWEAAVRACIPASYGIAGQSCVSLQRLYVHRSLYERVTERFGTLSATLKLGDTLAEDTEVGVMINESAAARIESWISEAQAAGARVVTGGTRHGTSVAPTVLTDVRSDMKVVCDEVFGPLVSIIPYDTLDEALAAVNDSRWGLASGVFTQSLAVALRVAREVRTGVVNVNAPSRYRVEHMPYGGVKASGWGKEGPRYSIDEMSEVRMVIISAAP
jgi:acyl-CoA reductase-like NAD-dependent aldehyde dehydrogenase